MEKSVLRSPDHSSECWLSRLFFIIIILYIFHLFLRTTEHTNSIETILIDLDLPNHCELFVPPLLCLLLLVIVHRPPRNVPVLLCCCPAATSVRDDEDDKVKEHCKWCICSNASVKILMIAKRAQTLQFFPLVYICKCRNVVFVVVVFCCCFGNNNSSKRRRRRKTDRAQRSLRWCLVQRYGVQSASKTAREVNGWKIIIKDRGRPTYLCTAHWMTALRYIWDLAKGITTRQQRW